METTILRKISKLGFDTEPGGFGYSLKKNEKVVFFVWTHTINEDRYKNCSFVNVLRVEVVLIVSNNSDDIQNGIPIYIYQISG